MAYVKKKQGSKQEVAYQKIKEAILKNEYEPDTMLLEGNLCAALGFSRTPVREALRRLASEGFVEFVPEKGTFVPRIRLEDLIEIYDVREALEGMAARVCALKGDEKVVAKLEEIVNSLYDNLVKGEKSQSVREDMEFHNVIIKGCNNSRLEAFLKTMIDQINRFAATTVNDNERLKISYTEHKKVLDAIKNKDADMAEKAIREHIRSVKEYQIKRHYHYNYMLNG